MIVRQEEGLDILDIFPLGFRLQVNAQEVAVSLSLLA
jgi:hypothetical protein